MNDMLSFDLTRASPDELDHHIASILAKNGNGIGLWQDRLGNVKLRTLGISFVAIVAACTIAILLHLQLRSGASDRAMLASSTVGQRSSGPARHAQAPNVRHDKIASTSASDQLSPSGLREPRAAAADRPHWPFSRLKGGYRASPAQQMRRVVRQDATGPDDALRTPPALATNAGPVSGAEAPAPPVAPQRQAATQEALPAVRKPREVELSKAQEEQRFSSLGGSSRVRASQESAVAPPTEPQGVEVVTVRSKSEKYKRRQGVDAIRALKLH